MDKRAQDKIETILGYKEEYRSASARLKNSEKRTLKIGEYDVEIYFNVLDTIVSVKNQKAGKPGRSVISAKRFENGFEVEVGGYTGVDVKRGTSRFQKIFKDNELGEALDYVLGKMLLDDCSKRSLGLDSDAVKINKRWEDYPVSKNIVDKIKETFLFLPTGETQAYAILVQDKNKKEIILNNNSEIALRRFVLPDGGWENLKEIELIHIKNDPCCTNNLALEWLDKKNEYCRRIFHEPENSPKFREDISFFYSDIILESAESLNNLAKSNKLKSKGVLISRRPKDWEVVLEILEVAVGGEQKLIAVPITNWFDVERKEIRYALNDNLRGFIQPLRWNHWLKVLRLALSETIYPEKVRDMLEF